MVEAPHHHHRESEIVPLTRIVVVVAIVATAEMRGTTTTGAGLQAEAVVKMTIAAMTVTAREHLNRKMTTRNVGLTALFLIITTRAPRLPIRAVIKTATTPAARTKTKVIHTAMDAPRTTRDRLTAVMTETILRHRESESAAGTVRQQDETAVVIAMIEMTGVIVIAITDAATTTTTTVATVVKGRETKQLKA